jgi:hypothetical protein
VLCVIVSIIIISKTIFSHKRTDKAKELSLPLSTLNLIIAKKRKTTEQADKCGSSAKKRKMDKERPIASWKIFPLPGTSMRHTCGWDHPVGEIPQNSCNNGD